MRIVRCNFKEEPDSIHSCWWPNLSTISPNVIPAFPAMQRTSNSQRFVMDGNVDMCRACVLNALFHLNAINVASCYSHATDSFLHAHNTRYYRLLGRTKSTAGCQYQRPNWVKFKLPPAAFLSGSKEISFIMRHRLSNALLVKKIDDIYLLSAIMRRISHVITRSKYELPG